jgi:hypothetical protein
MKQTLILLGLAAGVICDSSIKHRLGQIKAKTLAESEQAQCSCMIPPGAVGYNPSYLSQGTYSNWAHGAAVSQGQTVQTIPDVAQTEEAKYEACECSEAASQSSANGSIGKHYQVQGAIEVTEEVSYYEAGSSSASANGASHKQSACVVNNLNNTNSGAPTPCSSVCLTPSTSGASGAVYHL